MGSSSETNKQIFSCFFLFFLNLVFVHPFSAPSSLFLSLSIAFFKSVPLFSLPLTRFPPCPTFTGQMPKAVLLCPQLPSLTVLCKTLLMCVCMCMCERTCEVLLVSYLRFWPSDSSQSSPCIKTEARHVVNLELCGLVRL